MIVGSASKETNFVNKYKLSYKIFRVGSEKLVSVGTGDNKFTCFLFWPKPILFKFKLNSYIVEYITFHLFHATTIKDFIK
jgi:hypothetical protein